MQNKFVHWIAAVLLFGIPMIVSSHSPILDVTVGGALNAVYLWLSHLVAPTVPKA